VSGAGVSPVPGADGWEFGAFARDTERHRVRIPLVRAADGRCVELALPGVVSDAEDIAAVARIVIAAVERSEALEGLGA
jgi:hypothetical protein